MATRGSYVIGARHGLFVVALAAALGLLASGWSSRSHALALADTVNQGQAEVFLRALREWAPASRGRPSDAAMHGFMERYRVDGLRGIGVLDRDGALRTKAGALSNTPVPPRFVAGPHVERAGDLVRVYGPPPGEAPGRPPGAPPPPFDAPSFAPPDGPFPIGAPPADRPPPGDGPLFDGPHDRPPPGAASMPVGTLELPPGALPSGIGVGRTVMEFEPRLAQSLVDRADRSFAISGIVAAILVAATTLLWLRAVREARLHELLSRSERLLALGTMSAVLAHEIKNPLASLKGNAQLVVESLDEGSRPRAQAERVVEAAVRLQALVANLLDFARGGPIVRADVDPGEIVFLAACEASPKAALSLEGAPPTFSLDGVRMGQVVENILRNAEQASPERVSAEVTRSGDRLVIVVRDEGPGFSATPESYFEPFATTKPRGTGLGLAVARRIVELHGGTITARNRPDRGAEVTITIPPAK